MKATELLEAQHRKVEQLFKRIESGRSDKKATVRELADALGAHMMIEEEIFYPAVKKVKEDLVMESYEEHDVARYALRNLLGTSVSDERFDARVTALKELIEHHVKEEEEDLFPKVRKAMADETQSALGKEMKDAFGGYVDRGFVKLWGSSPTAHAKPSPSPRPTAATKAFEEQTAKPKRSTKRTSAKTNSRATHAH